MRSRYWRKAEVRITEWDKQLTSLGELLDYLVSHGADFRRWKSLSASSKRIEPLFVLILRLNLESAPSLERITFKKHVSENAPNMNLAYPYTINRGPAWENSDANIISNHYCISRTALPNLRCVDFGFVPCDFMFDRPSPLLTGLTHLNLEIDRDTVWIALSMRPFFSANSQLETLSLSSKACTASNRDMLVESKDPPIELLQLPSLSINATGPRHLNWVLSLLQMIDAPGLESFTLGLDNSWNYNHGLLAYIATGSTPAQRRRHNWHSDTEPVPTRIGPIYPALHSFDISKVEASYEALEGMLLPLSTVACLSIGHYDDHLRVLSSSRNMLPNLVALQITDKCNTSAVARCLYRRRELGIPVKDIIPRFTGHRRAKLCHYRWWFENEATIFNKCDDLLDLDLTDDENICERTGSSSTALQNTANVSILQSLVG
ncbi:unnamed protein product [Rhizoctonia solani]|uniref:Uncharacterized protein n=1 Tax=Rhizoctonia solani TaxID=456999 RepID=A0A8H3AAT3_9AGAM|nr:unnamed protein product [Rhizoctonia solani]